MRNLLKASVLAALFAFAAEGPASSAPPPIEAYGNLETIRDLELSPDGEQIAMLRNDKGQEGIYVLDSSGQLIDATGTDGIKVRTLSFAAPGYIVITGSKTISYNAGKDVAEVGAQWLYNVDEGQVDILHDMDLPDAFGRDKTFGSMIGTTPDRNAAVVETRYFARNSTLGQLSVFEVDLKRGRAKQVYRGQTDTGGYILNAEGKPFIRSDYDSDRRVQEFFVDRGDGFELFYSAEVDVVRSGIVGRLPYDEDKVLFFRHQDEGRQGYFEMSLADGSIGRELFTGGSSVAETITDTQDLVIGVRRNGRFPTYEFFDEAMTTGIKRIQELFPGHSVVLDSHSDDWTKILLRVEGPSTPGDWFLFDATKGAALPLGSSRPEIAPEDVVPMEWIEYTARDGLRIEGILTGRKAEGEAPKPMILLPHGGPHARDDFGFDWWAQYLASRGYTVFQPNFRGSTGYGAAFYNAGDGEWGGAMQDDLTDAVKFLVAEGLVDPNRICIMGASYGGYAALMGGGMTPELFQCVVAVAPPTDLSKFLLDRGSARMGSQNRTLDGWTRQFKVSGAADPKLEKMSPQTWAEKFEDPVLLIHGKDDSVVQVIHSEIMEDALKRAGKDVTFVELEGEDHWLSSGETRLALLRAIDKFLSREMPATR